MADNETNGVKSTKATKDDKMLAYLALQLGKMGGRAVGPAPNDEELAAMTEQALGQTRYAQVLSHIASSADVYRRWMRIAESMAALQDPKSARNADTATGKPGILQRLLDSLFGTHLRVGLFGGGLAATMVAVLAILLVPTMDQISLMEEQYGEWAPYINQQWATVAVQPKYQKQSSSSRAFTFKSEPQRIVEYGFQSGARTLGLNRFQSLGIQFTSPLAEPPQPAADMTREQFNILLGLGRLTALTTLKCELGLTSRDFRLSYDSAVYLSTEIRNMSDPKLAELGASFPTQSDKKKAVCDFTEIVVKTIL